MPRTGARRLMSTRFAALLPRVLRYVLYLRKLATSGKIKQGAREAKSSSLLSRCFVTPIIVIYCFFSTLPISVLWAVEPETFPMVAFVTPPTQKLDLAGDTSAVLRTPLADSSVASTCQDKEMTR
ncbi:unnamed protein product [Prunus armeniaca]|uniref:Uncharacterized protein n=1 Tax=Prunus armeniaca TaxID=36596 RepID=A0A6J5XKA9_PRUAR|nr:unnamed protein product [Prunus armeniaca]